MGRTTCMQAVLSLLSVSLVLAPVSAHDVGVLMFLHDAFDSPDVLSSWSWAKEPCQPPWFGVKECNQTSGCHTIGDASEDEQNCRILALDLNSLGLGGTISYVLGDSFRLQFLDLSNNSIGGPLPTGLQGISEVVNLQYFNVSHNQLNGTIPYDIGYMYSLQTVDFSNNNFSGELPASLGVLATGGNLTYLDLSGNSFTGFLPSQLAIIPTLKLGRVTSTGQIDLGGNSGLCNQAIPGLPPCPPGTIIPGLNTSQPPLPQLSPGALAPFAPRASVWGAAVLPVQEPSSGLNVSLSPSSGSSPANAPGLNTSQAPSPGPSPAKAPGSAPSPAQAPGCVVSQGPSPADAPDSPSQAPGSNASQVASSGPSPGSAPSPGPAPGPVVGAPVNLGAPGGAASNTPGGANGTLSGAAPGKIGMGFLSSVTVWCLWLTCIPAVYLLC